MKTIDFIVDVYPPNNIVTREVLRLESKSVGIEPRRSYTITVSQEDLEHIMRILSEYHHGFWEGLLRHLKHNQSEQKLKSANRNFQQIITDYIDSQ